MILWGGKEKGMIVGVGLDDICPVCDKKLLNVGQTVRIICEAELLKDGMVAVKVTHEACNPSSSNFMSVILNPEAIGREFDAVKYGEERKDFE